VHEAVLENGSVMLDGAFSAMVFIAMNCACMSVGNAGCGAVRHVTAFKLAVGSTSIQSSQH